MRPVLSRLFTAAVALLLTASAYGQASPAAGPKVGLALSGGGAKGFAHVGVLKVIEEAGLPVDVVTGTSMGSVVGALYALGYAPKELEKLVLDENWTGLLSDAALRRFSPLQRHAQDDRFLLSIPLRGTQLEIPTGLLAGQRISSLLSRLFLPAYEVRDFSALPIPFAAVATDLATGEGVRLTSGYLPLVLRGSIALPGVFNPVEIDGRTFIDGGIARNLPATDALALGADAVVCVDVGKPLVDVDSLDTFVDVLLQAVGFQMEASTQRQKEFCTVLIEPDMTGMSTYSFGEAAELLERGEAAARSVLPQLIRLRDSLGVAAHPPPPPRSVDSLYIRSVRVEGVYELPLERQIRLALRLDLPGRVAADDLAEAVARIYETQQVLGVAWRVEPVAGADEATLILDVRQRTRQRLDLSLRYDSEYRASMLLGMALPLGLLPGSALQTELRLGDVVRLGAQIRTPLPSRHLVTLVADAQVLRAPLDLFEGRRRISTLQANVVGLSAYAAGSVRGEAAVGAGLSGEFFNIDPKIVDNSIFNGSRGFLDEADRLIFAEVFAVLDRFDQRAFPSRGVRLFTRGAYSPAPLSSAGFYQHVLDANRYVPLSRRLSLIGRLTLGTTLGSDPPLHHRFYLGGPYLGGPHLYDTFPGRQFPLVGYSVQELSGRNVQALGLGLQIEALRGVFATARAETGRATGDWEWNLDPGSFSSGYSLSAGSLTFLGPVELTVMAAHLPGPYALRVNVGYAF